MHDLSRYKPLFRGDDSIVASASGIFSSEHSARWWFRHHRDEAVAAGVLILVNGRWLADPDCLAWFIAEAGRRDAEAFVARQAAV